MRCLVQCGPKIRALHWRENYSLKRLTSPQFDSSWKEVCGVLFQNTTVLGYYRWGLYASGKKRSLKLYFVILWSSFHQKWWKEQELSLWRSADSASIEKRFRNPQWKLLVVMSRSGLCMPAAGGICNTGSVANSSWALWILIIPCIFFQRL